MTNSLTHKEIKEPCKSSHKSKYKSEIENVVLRFHVFFLLKSANYLIRSSLFKRDDGHRSPEPSTYLALDCYSHPCILQSTL